MNSDRKQTFYEFIVVCIVLILLCAFETHIFREDVMVESDRKWGSLFIVAGIIIVVIISIILYGIVEMPGGGI